MSHGNLPVDRVGAPPTRNGATGHHFWLFGTGCAVILVALFLFCSRPSGNGATASTSLTPFTRAVSAPTFTLGPTATPVPTPTSTPLPTATPYPVSNCKNFGQGWASGELVLTAKARPYNGTWVDFDVQNKSSNRLLFDVPVSAFFLDFSDGRRINAVSASVTGDHVNINGLERGSNLGFGIHWSISSRDLDNALRQPQVTSYVVGVAGFHPDRLPFACWSEKVK
jgi:hypothetical protein